MAKNVSKSVAAGGPWANDLLHRHKEASLLFKFLTETVKDRKAQNRTGTIVLNIDAAWGQGKSFFMKAWRADLERQGVRVAYVDAWADDYAEDPFLAVVSSIDRSISKDRPKSVQSLLKTGGKLVSFFSRHVGRAVATRALGKDGAEIAGQVGAEVAKEGLKAIDEAIEKASDAVGQRIVREFEQTKATVEAFKTQLATALSTAGKEQPPLFVLIDELDRCRPTYAIALLERVKHLFEVDGVVFVIATDTDQLRHAIGAVYGVGFDAQGYLLRFFDRTYRFPQPDRKSLITFHLKSRDINCGHFRVPMNLDFANFFDACTSGADLSLRQLERSLDCLEVISRLWTRQWPMDLAYALALILSFVLHDKKIFAGLERGELDLKDLRNFLHKRPHTITYPSQDGYTKTETEFDLSDYIMRFSAMAKKSLPETVRSRAAEPINQWIIDGFQREFSVDHNNTFEGKGPASYVRAMGQLVQSVARFDDKAGTA